MLTLLSFKLSNQKEKELLKVKNALEFAANLDLECHAVHGLDYESARIIAKLPQIIEINIGHFIIGEVIFEGLESVIKKMRFGNLESRHG